MLNTTINKNKTYFGALDVILKILLGSKIFSIFQFRFLIISIMNYFPDQEYRGKIIKSILTFNTLDQEIIKFRYFIWPRFELNMVEK